jgi:hypothetical protein
MAGMERAVNQLELQVRVAWKAWAQWRWHSFCDACERPRYVGRGRRGGRRVCVDCWEHAPRRSGAEAVAPMSERLLTAEDVAELEALHDEYGETGP